MNLDKVNEGANWKFISLPIKGVGFLEAPIRVMAIAGANQLATSALLAASAMLTLF